MWKSFLKSKSDFSDHSCFSKLRQGTLYTHRILEEFIVTIINLNCVLNVSSLKKKKPRNIPCSLCH